MTKSTVKKHRLLLQSIYGERYTKHYSSRPGCFYCGSDFETLDHCPPLSLCETKNFEWFKKKKIKFYVVNCCIECNKKLSDKPLLTLKERSEYILSCLEDKAEKITFWTEEEIMEMSKAFERSIRARKQLANLVFDRIRFCQELQYREEDFPPEEVL
jgi:hypothetical protein